MAKDSKTKGRFLLEEKDFAPVVDAAGEELPAVPKHWGEDQLAPGASFAKPEKAAKKVASSGSGSRSSSGSGSGSGSGNGGGKLDDEPAGNASTEAWTEYAKTRGASEADLVDEQGEPLGQKALREKYGTPAS